MAHIVLADLPSSEWIWWKMLWFWYFEDNMWEEDYFGDSDDDLDEVIMSLEAALDSDMDVDSENDL